MERLTASNLVRFISQLDKKNSYNYVNLRNAGIIKVISTSASEGPIMIQRAKTSKGLETTKTESISSEMIWRVANAIEPGVPFNLDRLLGASYNTRSVLEALLAHTPEFRCKAFLHTWRQFNEPLALMQHVWSLQINF